MKLVKNQILEYWIKRSNQYKERAVGYRPFEKGKFIKQYLNSKYRTLDYGCGIGTNSQLFKDYLGVDIVKFFINIATNKYPEKHFLLLDNLFLPKMLDFDFEQFFTATVLQHNPDDVVNDVFKSVQALKSNNIIFSLYENSETNANHMKSRNSEDYVSLLSKHFKIYSYVAYKHRIFNAEHILTIIKT